MAEFKQGRYFIGVWFVGDGNKDFMGSIWRDPGSDHWDLEYRFRYYAGPDAWDGKDTKNWYTGKISTKISEADVQAKMDEVVSVVALGFGEILFTPMFTDDLDKQLEIIQNAPWAHGKKLSIEEAKEQGFL